MTSNASTLTGDLPGYSISNVTLDKSLNIKPITIQIKLALNNIFNTEYLSILSRPMPGFNTELFLSFIF